MNDAFLLHLRGPMQSYADTGFGPIREAGPFPSRSAVLGLIAAAQGVPRNDERLVALHAALRVHVATARAGVVRTDFHTVDAGGKNKAVTYRDYYHDAHFVTLVEARTPVDADVLTAARTALRSPYYVLYLGRRACPPSLPLHPEPVEGRTVLDALLNAVQHAQARHRRPYRRGDDGTRVYLDARLSATDIEAMRPGATLLGHGERRDLLVGPRRTYTGRPYTAVQVRASDEPSSDPQQAYFDAAS